MEDLTVDGDGGLLELARERREALAQRLQQLVDARRVDQDRVNAVCVACPAAW